MYRHICKWGNFLLLIAKKRYKVIGYKYLEYLMYCLSSFGCELFCVEVLSASDVQWLLCLRRCGH